MRKWKWRFDGRNRCNPLVLEKKKKSEMKTNCVYVIGFVRISAVISFMLHSIAHHKHDANSQCKISNCKIFFRKSTNHEIPALQPPSGFSDSQELSEAECDREDGRRARIRQASVESLGALPLFRHEELEQELSALIKR